MKNGVVLFAHNSRQLDYGLMSVISGGLAKKHLNVPVTLITDKATLDWMQDSNSYEAAVAVFDKIISVNSPSNENTRILNDGNFSQVVPFSNSNRYSVWELTPYENTLMIDSDYLIFSNSLNNYWNTDYDILISKSINDIRGDRTGVLEKYVSETGVHLYWATTVMFKKNNRSKLFFDLVNYIKDHYEYYSELFRFDPRQYRNDISFSIAKHILDGFEDKSVESLPPVLTILDKDVLAEVSDDGKLKILVNDITDSNKFSVASIKNTDIHIMNKQSIVRNKDQLLKLL
jgi:hypothetical protein